MSFAQKVFNQNYTQNHINKYNKSYKWIYLIDFYRRSELQYKANNFIWSFASLGYIFSILFVYYFSNKQVFGDFVAYNFVSYIIFIFTNSWVNLDVSLRIKNGQMTPLLLTPTHFIMRYFFMFVGRNCFAYFLMSIPAIFLFWLFAFPYIDFDFRWYNLIFTLLIIIGSYSISFWLNTLAGLLSFWTTNNDAVNESYFVFRNLFRGDLVMLTSVQAIFGWVIFQPFAFIGHHPFMTLTGKYTLEQISLVFLGAYFWVFLLWLICRLVLKLGLKKYEGTGL